MYCFSIIHSEKLTPALNKIHKNILFFLLFAVSKFFRELWKLEIQKIVCNNRYVKCRSERVNGTLASLHLESYSVSSYLRVGYVLCCFTSSTTSSRERRKLARNFRHFSRPFEFIPRVRNPPFPFSIPHRLSAPAPVSSTPQTSKPAR